MDGFQPVKIGNIDLRNRFVRSATWEGLATDDGFVTPELTAFVGRVAKGGVGLVISSHAYVQKVGQAGPWQLGIYDDACIPGLRTLAEAVHAEGVPVFAQLAHAGANAAVALTGMEPVAPSEMVTARGETARAMTEGEIVRLAEDFGRAAERAVEAGFDGVQIHAGHEYCLSQFFSPFYNQRDDRYGGDVERRANAFVDVYRAVRRAVGDRPVTAKLNAEDFIDGGMTEDMMLETAGILQREGVDAVEMSGGGGAFARWRSSRLFDPKTPDEEAYYRAAARRYQERLSMPLMLVGGIRSLEGARCLLEQGAADLISLCRPLIREPGLIGRWQSGNTARAACISCDGCRSPAALGEGLHCIFTGA